MPPFVRPERREVTESMLHSGRQKEPTWLDAGSIAPIAASLSGTRRSLIPELNGQKTHQRTTLNLKSPEAFQTTVVMGFDERPLRFPASLV